MIEIRKLVKKYPGAAANAVDGLDLTIEKGELFGLLGPNGAGKTTTLSILSALLEPTSGSARVSGFDVVKQAGEVKKRIGVVPQDLALYPALTDEEADTVVRAVSEAVVREEERPRQLLASRS